MNLEKTKIELIQFNDGKYGVRKTVKRPFKKPEYYYLDMSKENPESFINYGGKYFWSEDYRFTYGQTDDLELAKSYKRNFEDFGNPIEDK